MQTCARGLPGLPSRPLPLGRQLVDLEACNGLLHCGEPGASWQLQRTHLTSWLSDSFAVSLEREVHPQARIEQTSQSQEACCREHQHIQAPICNIRYSAFCHLLHGVPFCGTPVAKPLVLCMSQHQKKYIQKWKAASAALAMTTLHESEDAATCMKALELHCNSNMCLMLTHGWEATTPLFTAPN